MILVQLTDLHLRPLGQRAYGVVETNTLVERAFRAVAALRPAPDAVLISGDLTDCGLPEEYDLLSGLIERYLDMPVYLIPGNHDRREVMRARLAHLPGMAGEGFIQYAVDDHPVRLVMLDSVVPGSGHGELCAERLDFLDATLAAAPDTPTMVVLHHPPIHTGIRHMDRINLRTAQAMEEIVGRNRQVERILCGHAHRAIVARFAGTIAQVTPSVAHQVTFDLGDSSPESFGLEPPSFAVHRWTPESGIASHIVHVESYPGPYPFVLDPRYPGGKAEG